ncbi:metal ABC transporter ATP-binding protein [Syntrophorhabdus aromaticivorans]|uniref:metal ABC transporter ATP-binding protein n=1 Tax=Syntrophorhabdus aromaticivorans TaxID=328301 RepID=UPI000401027E|nr:metal ABC transporter ATP-binding protein [Syntrophorhabdus aromaticivorans]
MIDLSELTVQKGKKSLLHRVSLTVQRNEFVGIIGPNGAGKTTLLNVIAGVERFSGTLSLFGHREGWRRSRETRLRIGYVPQLFQIDPAFPILASEAIMTGAVGRTGLFRSPGRQERERVLQLMEMMRMGHLADRPLGQLSGGERQKVSLARAILQQPDILLLDEPTANLDIAVQREVLNLINEIHQRERLTVLLVTHDFAMLPAAMRRAVLLNRGHVVFDGEIDAALSSNALSKLFEYPLETFERNGRRFVSYG